MLKDLLTSIKSDKNMLRNVVLKKIWLTNIPTIAILFSLFIGTTFAWFDINFINRGNRIESGNLLVDLYASDEISDGDLAGNILNLKSSNSPLFSFNEINRQSDYIEKFIKVENKGSIPINYQVNFETIETSHLENFIYFEIQFLTAETFFLSALELDYTNIISLQDNQPNQGGLIQTRFEIWRIRMIVNQDFDEEVNVDGLSFEFDLKLRAWHFNYPLSSVLYFIDVYENNGSNKKQAYFVVNESITLRTPIKRGYQFLGWFEDSNLTQSFTRIKMPRANLEVFAKWQPIHFTITYELNNGQFETTPKTTYTIEDSFIFLQPIRNGYTFSGWYSSESLSDDSIYSSVNIGTIGSLSLFAKWNVNQYTVNFDANGGLQNISVTQDFNTSLTTPNITRRGFNLEGFYTEKTFQHKQDLSVMPANNLTVYARWLPKKLVNIETSDHKSFGYTDDGAIFTWGENTSRYITGLNNHISTPTYIPIQSYIDEEKSVKYITRFNNYLLMEDNKVFRLINNTISFIEFDFVEFNFSPSNIRKISDTSSNLYILYEEGRLFEMNISNSSMKEIVLLSLAENEFIIDIVTSRITTHVLTNLGNVYGFGSNSSGQIGVGGESNPSMSTISSPTKLNLSNIVSISTNNNNGFAINENGELFSWGSNAASGRGYNFGFNFWTPGKLSFPNLEVNEKIISVSNNSSHGLATTNFGNVFSWGTSGSKLGIGYDQNSYYSPQKILFNLGTDEKVIQVSAGVSYSLFLTNNGRLFACGSSDYGSLGTGGTSGHFYPVLANLPRE